MRPLGVSLVAIFMLFVGAVGVFLGLSMFAARDEGIEIFKQEYEELAKDFGVNIPEGELEFLYDAASISMLTFGFLYFAAGWGLLNMREWGRILAVLLCGLNALYGMMMTFLSPIFAIEIAVNVLVIWYLMKVRELFAKRVSIEERILSEEKHYKEFR
ncbi:MAG: hypothetical protein ABWW66_04670 [Archaeoglobaceae archaeon]